MDHSFSNRDAAIFGAIAIVEFIFFFVYVTVTSIKLRKKIISMGRLIPTIQMVVSGGIVAPSHVIQVCPQNPYTTYPPAQCTQPPPLPPGFQPYENPPPYSTAAIKPPTY